MPVDNPSARDMRFLLHKKLRNSALLPTQYCNALADMSASQHSPVFHLCPLVPQPASIIEMYALRCENRLHSRINLLPKHQPALHLENHALSQSSVFLSEYLLPVCEMPPESPDVHVIPALCPYPYEALSLLGTSVLPLLQTFAFPL